MSNQLVNLFLFFALLGFSNIYAQNSKIIGKWSPDMEVMASVYKKVIEKEKDDMEGRLKTKLTKENIETLIKSFAKLLMEFRGDGSYSFHYQNPFTEEISDQKGTWTYENGYIHTIEKESDRKEILRVIKNTKKILVFTLENDPKSPIQKFILKKVK